MGARLSHVIQIGLVALLCVAFPAAAAANAGPSECVSGDSPVVLAEFDAGDPATPTACYFNGPNYLDEKLLIRGGAGTGGSAEFYVLLKDLYTIAGLTDADGQLFEWYTYSGYGPPTIHGTGLAAAPLLFGDADGDCDVDLVDFAGFQRFFSGSGNPHAPGGAVFDSDGDGDVDFADFQALAANLNGPGSGSCATRVNPFGFTGQRVDVLAGGALVLYDCKARVYDPRHGRFQQRDPGEFADTYNLYEYAASRVTVLTDPTGEFALADISIGTAIRSGLHALNAYGNAQTALRLARALKAGVGVQQVMTGLIIELAMDRLGGKALDGLLAAYNKFASGFVKSLYAQAKHHKHHLVPKFLGGLLSGKTFDLPESLHKEFHRELREKLKQNGIDLPENAGQKAWERLFIDDPTAFGKAKRALLEATAGFDSQHGTNLLSQLVEEMQKQGWW